MAELSYWITLDCTGVLNEGAGWCMILYVVEATLAFVPGCVS